MTDIVERLRDASLEGGTPLDILMLEAADEIKRLRKEQERNVDAMAAAVTIIRGRIDDIERHRTVRAAIEKAKT